MFNVLQITGPILRPQLEGEAGQITGPILRPQLEGEAGHHAEIVRKDSATVIVQAVDKHCRKASGAESAATAVSHRTAISCRQTVARRQTAGNPADTASARAATAAVSSATVETFTLSPNKDNATTPAANAASIFFISKILPW